MKKLFTIFTLVLCSFVFVISGCGGVPEDNYWETAQAELETLFSSKSYNDIQNMTFSTNVVNLMRANEDGDKFSELANIYLPTLNSSLSFTFTYYNVLKVVPIENTKDLKNSINKFVENAKSFKKNIELFLDSKTLYEQELDLAISSRGLANAEHDIINQQNLLEFKRIFFEFIQKSYNLSNEFFNIYTKGYKGFVDFQKLVALEGENAQIYKALAVDATNFKVLKSSMLIIETLRSTKYILRYQPFFTMQKDYYNNYIHNRSSYSISPDDLQNLKTWQVCFEMYSNEVENLELAFKKVDMIGLGRDFEWNIDKYSTKKGNELLKTYFDYIENFNAKTLNMINILSDLAL